MQHDFSFSYDSDAECHVLCLNTDNKSSHSCQ